MHRRSATARMAVALGIAIHLGCHRLTPAPTHECPSSTNWTLAADAAQADRPPWSSLEYLAREIPGFGGAFIRDGALHVWLTDTSAANTARRVLQPMLLAQGRPDLPVRLIEADYSYRQLEGFFHALSQYLPPGFTHYRVDPWTNRAHLGVTTAEAQKRVRATIERLCLPMDAIIVELATPARVGGG